MAIKQTKAKGDVEMSPLNEVLNELKQFGIKRADIIKQNNISKQYAHLIFKNYSKIYMGYQAYMLNRAIRKRLIELQHEQLKLNCMIEKIEIITEKAFKDS